MSSWDRKLLILVLWVVAVEAVAFVLVGSVEYFSREPLLERPGDPVERIPHLLPGQLGLLGPEHLRALPGAGDRGRDVGAAVGEGAADAGAADRRWSRSSGSGSSRPSRSRASPPCWPAWPCSPRCAGAGAGRSRRWAPEPSWRCSSSSSPAALKAQPRSHQRRHRRPRQPGLRRHPTSSPSARSGATAPAASPRAYREHVATKKAPVSVSHTEPITVAAEQGLVGLLAYAALIVVALWTMAAGLRLAVSPSGDL